MTLEQKYDLALRIIKDQYKQNGEMRLQAFLRLVGEPDDWDTIRKGTYLTPELEAPFIELLKENDAISQITTIHKN